MNNKWLNVFVQLWDKVLDIDMAGPCSLLLNPDKSFKAFGSDAENQVNFGQGQELGNCYYFPRFATAFYSKRVSVSVDFFLLFVPFNMLIIIQY